MLLRQVFLALILLALGFACAETVLGAALSETVAQGLALAALPLLQIFDPQILREGAELRSPEGWAIRVTAVCDGHGLVIAFSVAALLLKIGLRRWVFGLLAIQIFNLSRVIALGLTLGFAPAAFDALHGGFFPLLTVALLAFCLLEARRAGLLLALSAPLYALWLPLADELALPFVALANGCFALLPLPELGLLAERSTGWSMGSQLLAGQTPAGPSLYLAPLRPADFLLALPLLFAALGMARQVKPLLIALPCLLAALICGAVTTVWALAAANAPALLLIADGGGAYLATPFTPPEAARAVMRLLQNTLVHFNLLVLPILIAAKRGAMEA